MQRGTWLGVIALFCGTLFVMGCGGGKPLPPKGVPAAGHSHDEKGPHGGQVLGLGDEEFHAEFVLEEASGKVTVYLLDKAIKNNPAATSAQETITIDDKSGKKFELAAVDRTTGDMPTASQFELVDKELHGPIKTELATLHVTIGGKEFHQKIAFGGHGHDHDH